MMAKQRFLFRRMVEAFTGSKLGAWITLNVASRFDPFFLRATHGRFSTSNLFGFSALILTTMGAKTGLLRQVALTFFHDDNRIVIVASRGGMDRHPSWYHNLKAHPEAAVLLDGCSTPTRPAKLLARNVSVCGQWPVNTMPVTLPIRNAPATGRSPSWC